MSHDNAAAELAIRWNEPCLAKADRLLSSVHRQVSASGTFRRNFAAEWQISADHAEAAAARRQERVEQRYDAPATDLPELKVGAHVAVQNRETGRWGRYGPVMEVGRHRRYVITMPSGRVLSRNRRHIRRRYGCVLLDEQSGDGASRPGSTGPTTTTTLSGTPATASAGAATLQQTTPAVRTPIATAPAPPAASHRDHVA
ncbi:hypothetical protein FJT64_010595 [Amphibalanus amphitrite]|uniref:Uncharacterized protein n=1 Tax=Amphibalanus amphitrite TaxID=1232801 RepID=A0A6A4VL46_AMPAM|nr:hypothetical protein FJT64_010595 [Amphibalanus amphitrite]